MLTQDYYDQARQLVRLIKSKLPNATYISVLLFDGERLIESVNNNYNCWADNYNQVDMTYDQVFFDISHKKLKTSGSAICFWNSVPHSSKESLDIHKRRSDFGLYNGITVLESINDKYTLGLNITSNDKVDEDTFYASVILKRKLFIRKAKEFTKELCVDNC